MAATTPAKVHIMVNTEMETIVRKEVRVSIIDSYKSEL